MKKGRFNTLFEFTYTLYRFKLINDKNELEDFFEALLYYWRQYDRTTSDIGVKQIGSDGVNIFR